MKAAALSKLERADANADAARVRLVAATMEAFPVGSRVRYSFERNRKTYYLYGEVTGHGGNWSWHGAGDIVVKNEATGKGRSINAAFHLRSGSLTLLSVGSTVPCGVKTAHPGNHKG